MGRCFVSKALLGAKPSEGVGFVLSGTQKGVRERLERNSRQLGVDGWNDGGLASFWIGAGLGRRSVRGTQVLIGIATMPTRASGCSRANWVKAQ
jgi:hypothetical protein